MREQPTRTGASDLDVGPSRLGRYLGVFLALLLLAVALWFVLHPSPLPTSDRTVQVRTPVGVPIYVGVYAGSQAGRTIHLSSVHVNAPEDSTGLLHERVTVSVRPPG